MKHLLVTMVRIYQQTLSRVTPARCRFYPTCSDYTIEAVQKHGIVYGLWLSFRRICRCHPWNPGGVDLVPDVGGQKSDADLNGFNERSDFNEADRPFERK